MPQISSEISAETERLNDTETERHTDTDTETESFPSLIMKRFSSLGFWMPPISTNFNHQWSLPKLQLAIFKRNFSIKRLL